MSKFVVRSLLAGLSFAVMAFSGFTASASSPMAVYSWTGFYIGGNFGGGWGTERTTGTNTSIDFNGPAAGLPLISSVDGSTRASGISGGGQFGYNYQFSSNWLVGVETEIGVSNIKGSSVICGITVIDVFGTFAPGSISGCADTSVKLQTFGTVRPRLGYVFDNLMVYGTGGWAWSHGTSNRQDLGVVAGGNASISTTFLNGWTAGAGAEWAFLPHWTFRVEYLHLQFGPTQITETNLAVVKPATTLITLTETLNPAQARVSADIVRIGLNYMFK